MSERVRRAALSFLNDLEAHHAAREAENADGFMVVTLDPETPAMHLNGPFTSGVDALVWAEQHAEELNRGNGPNDAPFTCHVYTYTTPEEAR